MTLKEIIEKLRNKDISSIELAEFYLDKIKELNKDLNIYISVDEAGIKKSAKAVQEKLKINLDRPLLGVPYAVKDNILVKGLLATAGSKILENYKAPYEATVISQLRGEGALVLGKTNMDEFAMGSSTENSAYGATKNPIDTSRVPGGSSGGSAAAVAADLAPWALGSDTGGSIRQPGAFCGVVGFKPTYGAVSRYGLIALASSLDQIGLLTKTTQDAKIIFPYILNKDERDSTSISIENTEKTLDIKKLKIGIAKEFFSEGLEDRVRGKVDEAINVYRKMGASIKEISLPHANNSLAVYYIIMPAEASSNLARYDGIRYGKHLKEDASGDLLSNYLKIRGDGFGKEVKRRIMLGTYILSAGYYDAYYLKAQKVRKLIMQDFQEVFRDVDVILSPTTPTPAFKAGEKTHDPLSMYLSDIYTVSANLTGLPAISIPVGTVKEGEKKLPVGMQLIAPHKKDFKLLNIAEAYEKEIL